MAEIELKTAPVDFRFPTTNQTRHCFTRYIEFHRCMTVKGENSGECEKFAKYYRSLCPGEWMQNCRLTSGMNRGTMGLFQDHFESMCV
uniref:Cytochrome c oxidase subunit n=1 Tax=Medicago truncatula TaxID=3880 RepID=I3SGC1_MEDTR|nr:unknown [Medicago truncatula]